MSTRTWRVTGFILLLLTLSIAFSKGKGVGGDFRAYYAVGTRLWHGGQIYVSEDAAPFKYSPLAAVILSPFSLIPFRVGMALYLGLLALLLAWLPLATLNLAVKRSGLGLPRSRLFTSVLVGLVCGLRFVDNELHSLQVNSVSLGFILLACTLWMKNGRRYSWLGALAFGAGALFKFHPLLAVGVFFKKWPYRSALLIGAAVLALALLPSPIYWRGYTDHMATTGQGISLVGSTILQGFFPFCATYFGSGRGMPLAFFFILAAIVSFRVPKFDFFETGFHPADRPAGFLISVAALLLLALSASPIPWQHTYLVLWVFVPLSYAFASREEKIALWSLSLAMGISARGIFGPGISGWLEKRQSVFILALAFVALFLSQARRLKAA